MKFALYSMTILMSIVGQAGFAQTACEGFCFPENLEALGGGSFEQEVSAKAVIEVPGVIPAGVKNLYVELNSAEDVDIQLFDASANNKPLVGWKIGALIDSGSRKSVDYQGVTIEYSGYNGIICGDRGHESIQVTGTTQNDLLMKIYGYKEGSATVTYSYEGNGTRSLPPGSGQFEQRVDKKAVVEVPGDIPAGIKDLYIALKSDVDVDIQLFDVDADKALVGWKIGAVIDSKNVKNKDYNGVNIEYSGYNGTGFKRGHEYIKITGLTRNTLRMKLYGYQEGYAEISYNWQ